VAIHQLGIDDTDRPPASLPALARIFPPSFSEIYKEFEGQSWVEADPRFAGVIETRALLLLLGHDYRDVLCLARLFDCASVRERGVKDECLTELRSAK